MIYPPSNHPARESALERTAQKHLTLLGYHFVTHVEGLPGKPDIFLPDRRIAIQVFGCFFHQHGPDCKYCSTPPSHRYDWDAKFRAIRMRDQSNLDQMLRRHYRQLTLWGCSLSYGLGQKLRHAISDFVEGSAPHRAIGRLDLLAMPELTGSDAE
jgi:DNA mismatch endonuclease (patch repair protein)